MPKGAPTCVVDTCLSLKICFSEVSQAPQWLFRLMECASKSSKWSLRPYFCQNGRKIYKKWDNRISLESINIGEVFN